VTALPPKRVEGSHSGMGPGQQSRRFFKNDFRKIHLRQAARDHCSSPFHQGAKAARAAENKEETGACYATAWREEKALQNFRSISCTGDHGRRRALRSCVKIPALRGTPADVPVKNNMLFHIRGGQAGWMGYFHATICGAGHLSISLANGGSGASRAFKNLCLLRKG
jgi:hypothetical protein